MERVSPRDFRRVGNPEKSRGRNAAPRPNSAGGRPAAYGLTRSRRDCRAGLSPASFGPMAALLPLSAAAPSFDSGEVAHELNNALAPVLLAVDLLRPRVADPAAQRHLERVAGNAWRGAALARQILALTAAAAGAQANQRRALPARTAASSADSRPPARASASRRPKPGSRSSLG